MKIAGRASNPEHMQASLALVFVFSFVISTWALTRSLSSLVMSFKTHMFLKYLQLPSVVQFSPLFFRLSPMSSSDTFIGRGPIWHVFHSLIIFLNLIFARSAGSAQSRKNEFSSCFLLSSSDSLSLSFNLKIVMFCPQSIFFLLLLFHNISYVCNYFHCLSCIVFPSTVAHVGVWGNSSAPFVLVVPDSCTRHLFTACVVISSIHILSTTGSSALSHVH